MFRVSKLALAVCLAVASVSPGADAFAPATSIGHVNTRAVTTGSSPAFVAQQQQQQQQQQSTAFRMAEGSAVEGATSTLVRKPDSAVELTITAPGSATKAAYDKAIAEVSKQLSVPGFRKGAKIPPQVIENTMASRGGSKFALREQAISTLINELIEPCLKDEHNLEPIGQPELVLGAEELAKRFEPGKPIDMAMKCDVWPDVKWEEVEGQEKPYFGLTGKYKRKPFNEARFNKALGDLKDKYATLSDMEEGKALEMGDACVVNMVGYMAQEDGKTKGEPLPNAASGDSVEVILGDGRYMEGLVEGLIGAKVGETREIYVSFPEKLRDKTLAGKKAVFDVEVASGSIRTVPEVTDEFAAIVREGLTAETLVSELRKAIDEEDLKEFVEERNKALAKSLAERLDCDVPDTIVTNQAREKYSEMMTDFRDNGMADEEIKKMITPENFLKYKDIEKPDIVRDFKVSMATDEIARLEGIEVPANAVDEQMANLRKEAGDGEFDENRMRASVESTLQRRQVYDFLTEHSDLEVEYVDEEGGFDENLMNQLAEESLQREKELEEKQAAEAAAAAPEEAAEPVAVAEPVVAEPEPVVEAEPELEPEPEDVEAPVAEETPAPAPTPAPVAEEKDYGSMDLEDKAFNILVDLGMVDKSPDPDSPDYDNSKDDEFAE
mmetsp:Transcript_31391/g.91998  ORF Transcript_31391/g.91998 Transcript_31391/m.91998 type:complete len:667 (+) Transcript_31391:133-2133(+)